MGAYSTYMGTDSDTPFVSDTSIRVSEELADELYQRKGRSTSYEDYIWQLLERVDELEDDETADGPMTVKEAEESRLMEEEAMMARWSGEAPPGSVTEHDIDDLREELAGSGELLEARVKAILAMYERLKELGEAERSDLLEVVDPEEVDYTGGESSTPEESTWSNLIKGKNTLQKLPGVEKPPKGKTTWRFRE